MPQIDPEALARHLDRLYRAAWALCGSREEAEDLVQETYVRVLSRPRSIRNDSALPYLLAALRNTFLDSRRHAALRPQSVAEIGELELADPRAQDEPAAALKARELFAAIAALPVDFRLALIAVDVAGLSHQEAATLLSTREATIATRLFRARARVARALDGEDAVREATSADRRLIEERQR